MAERRMRRRTLLGSVLLLGAITVAGVIATQDGGGLGNLGTVSGGTVSGGTGSGGTGSGSTGTMSGSGYAASQRAVVDRVVDGDTIVVRLSGTTERVRLLNIDTPESVDPNRMVECLGPEASAFLADLLPTGIPVRLDFDRDLRDRYDRMLAGVFLDDGTFVNGAIAAAGFAEPVVFDDNRRFLPAVSRSVDEARAAGRGLWASAPAC